MDIPDAVSWIDELPHCETMEDVTIVDQKICASGMTEYIRPIYPVEIAEAILGGAEFDKKPTDIWVKEMYPGARARRFVGP